MQDAALVLDFISVAAAGLGNCDVASINQLLHYSLHGTLGYAYGKRNLSHADVGLLRDQHNNIRMIG
jgi:hypothetical protein